VLRGIEESTRTPLGHANIAAIRSEHDLSLAIAAV
jgi:hypothetical protein